MKTPIVIGFLLVAAAVACASSDDEGGDVSGDVGEVNGAKACKDFTTLSTCERNPKCDWVNNPKCAGSDDCALICVDAPKK